jgi:dimeric dUTPase (all-alpha-NTP-PPase superfamily)
MFFNMRQVLTPLVSKDPYMAITEDYHDDLTDLQAFMLTNAETTDVLIASRIYSRYIEWVGEPLFREVYDFQVQSTEDEILAVVDQFDSGWIIIDNARIERATFSPDTSFLGNDRIEYIGLFDGEHVWRWRVKQK